MIVMIAAPAMDRVGLRSHVGSDIEAAEEAMQPGTASDESVAWGKVSTSQTDVRHC